MPLASFLSVLLMVVASTAAIWRESTHIAGTFSLRSASINQWLKQPLSKATFVISNPDLFRYVAIARGSVVTEPSLTIVPDPSTIQMSLS